MILLEKHSFFFYVSDSMFLYAFKSTEKSVTADWGRRWWRQPAHYNLESLHVLHNLNVRISLTWQTTACMCNSFRNGFIRPIFSTEPHRHPFVTKNEITRLHGADPLPALCLPFMWLCLPWLCDVWSIKEISQTGINHILLLLII